MRAYSIVIAAALCAGCSVQRLSPEGLVLSRPVTVPARDVAVYDTAAAVPARHSVVEEIWVKDDGSQSPGEMLRDCGSRPARAAPTPSSSPPPTAATMAPGVSFTPTLDNPFDYYSATAIWIGAGPPPAKILR